MEYTDKAAVEILEIFTEKQNYDEKYSNLMLSFILKAHELVELSNDLYQLENTIRLNQISLKDYILNSEICKSLKNSNINNYSIDDLKSYMTKYDNQENIKSYQLALELYERLEEIEYVESAKINYEIDRMSNILEVISTIKAIEKSKYQNLYKDLINQLRIKYLNNNLIDDKINNYAVQILNDIFNYYLYGNKEIPVNFNI